jgi:hypothetical protein
MELFIKAKKYAIGSVAKQRCEENTDNLQEWIDEKPERDKQKQLLRMWHSPHWILYWYH